MYYYLVMQEKEVVGYLFLDHQVSYPHLVEVTEEEWRRSGGGCATVRESLPTRLDKDEEALEDLETAIDTLMEGLV